MDKLLPTIENKDLFQYLEDFGPPQGISSEELYHWALLSGQDSSAARALNDWEDSGQAGEIFFWPRPGLFLFVEPDDLRLLATVPDN